MHGSVLKNKCVRKTHIPPYGAIKRKRATISSSWGYRSKNSKDLSGILATPRAKFLPDR